MPRHADRTEAMLAVSVGLDLRAKEGGLPHAGRRPDGRVRKIRQPAGRRQGRTGPRRVRLIAVAEAVLAKSSSICSRLWPLVSGTMTATKASAARLKTAYIRNVPAL